MLEWFPMPPRTPTFFLVKPEIISTCVKETEITGFGGCQGRAENNTFLLSGQDG